MNRNVKTVRPSAIETGMPVSMKAIRSTKIVIARTACGTTMTPVFCAIQIARIKIGAMMSVSASGLAQRCETVP